MPAEKTDGIVIRLADFSESSKVVTLFTREHGKLAGLAKGAKRLKGPFEGALDLLSECRVVFLRRGSGGLDLLTEAQLISRFRPPGRNVSALYAGYYLAELLDGLTEVYDPHPQLYQHAVDALARFARDDDPRLAVILFELALLNEIGHLPDFTDCSACHQPIDPQERARFWVSQGGLLCPRCGRPEYVDSEISAGSVAVLARLAAPAPPANLTLSSQQFRELRRVLTAAVSRLLERRPRMLNYLKF